MIVCIASMGWTTRKRPTTCPTPYPDRSAASLSISAALSRPRSPTHKAHPYARRGEFDGCEEVRGVLFVAGCDGAVVFELREKALDEIALAVEPRTEGERPLAAPHWSDVHPCAAIGEGLAQPIAVVSAVGEQDLALAQSLQHVGGARAVMGLALGELQRDGQAVGVDKGVDLRGQPAPRAPHALGSSVVPSGGRRGVRPPFLTLPPC